MRFFCANLLAAWMSILFAQLGTAAELVDNKQPPLTPQGALQAITLPPGFKATLFAGEPDIVQPIAFCIDDRGRLWVAENTSYGTWKPEGNDRIVILEDADGDGRFDKKTVFCDKLNFVSGVQISSNGVFVTSPPNLYFFPDSNHDDKPDSEPQILLDGWNHKDLVHNVVNSLTWGPDGWLYGANGISNLSHIGKPGAPIEQRTPIKPGIWRYHPTKQIFEVFAHGGTNAWGLDYDEQGQFFYTNCVINHLNHVVQGGHYHRMFGKDFNPYLYGEMEPAADHLHWAGGEWTTSRGGTGAHSLAGGGHAHCGAMIYLGDNWPDSLRGRIFMNNIHGHRINMDVLERKGSGYVAHHGQDFMFANDKWHMGVTLHYGPDGGVFLSDWYDTGECHTYTADKSNGRIYKIVYGEPKAITNLDLNKLSDMELVQLHLHRNEYYVRHARRILAERGVNPLVHSALLKIYNEAGDSVLKLRAMFTLHCTGGLSEEFALVQLRAKEDYIRAWAIQFLAESRNPSDRALNAFADLARTDSSPVVRLFLASALQRIAEAKRWPILEALVGHEEDTTDQNLPLMYWYATEPLVPADLKRALALAGKTKIPLIREYITRRIVSLTK